MKKKFLFLSMILICAQRILGQTAAEVLESGVPVERGHRLFLKYDISDKILKVDAAKKDQDADFTALEDSLTFLVRKNAVNIYLKPLNPLNYSYNTETKIIIDPINEAVFGHEYIHAYHRYLGLALKYGSKYSDYTESSAYHFTINLLKSHGQDYSGFLNQFYNYGGKFPGIFNWTDAIKNIVNFKN